MTIDLARAVHIVEKAFLPLHGEVREDPSDASFSFAVTDGSQVLASVAHVARSQYSHAGHLAAWNWRTTAICWNPGRCRASRWPLPGSARFGKALPS